MDTISFVLFIGLFFFFLAEVIYYVCFFAKPVRYQHKMGKGEEVMDSGNYPAVSVIICAQNESQNLEAFLPSILEQDYPVFEVIVINDGSTDETEEVLGSFMSKYDNLYKSYVPLNTKNLSRKKLAITIGVKAAKYDILLFTDASCKPLNPKWIHTMSRHFNPNTNIVIGFNTFGKSRGIRTKYAVYDNLIEGIRYLSLALYKKPYMGVGQNLSYRKELFYENKGFSRHLSLRAGEDDLFINEILDAEKTAVEISPESITVSKLENGRMWNEIKMSRVATQRHFKSGPVAFWRIETICRCLFLALFVISLLYGIGMSDGLLLPLTASGLFLIRMIIQLIVINQLANKLSVEKFYFTLPFFDIIQPFVDIHFYIHRIFKGKRDYTWR